MSSAIFKNVTCVQCGEREAFVFIRRNGEGDEGCDIALCESCAKGRGISAGKGGFELNIDDLIGDSLDSSRLPGAGIACPGCGLELVALKREARLGCSRCADAFFHEISRILGRRAVSAPGRPRADREPRPVAASERRRLDRELAAALASEDYETAARLRDELSRAIPSPLPTAPATFVAAPAPRAAGDFPFDPGAFDAAEGAEDDVVLCTSARVCRNIDALPFPGSPGGPSNPSRAALREKILSYGFWREATMAGLGPVARRSLSERGIVPRGYAADDAAIVLSDAEDGLYALLDEGDHLRVRSVVPGLDPSGAIDGALSFADRVGEDFAFARKDGIGWICSRISDCGIGCTLSATIHIPAIVAAGMRDRLFKTLLSDGAALKGFYSSSEESAGSVYELRIDPSNAATVDELVAEILSALAKVIAAERRARAEIVEKGRDALVDAEGRAFGIARHCRLLGAEEAASLLSVLRLAALRSSLVGANHRVMGSLLQALGPGSVALASGMGGIPSPSTLDTLRARLVKDALARAEYVIEEGA
jgi:protein-arginine kinase/protein-arginine kinase activator protein McsA